jgi:predicted nucleic acid-binding protein
VAELVSGVELLPEGQKRTALEVAIESILNRDFSGQVLDFDVEAAYRYAQIRAQRRRAGHPIADLDAQIAAIALVHDATLATRNTRDFEQCGVRLVNPWESL